MGESHIACQLAYASMIYSPMALRLQAADSQSACISREKRPPGFGERSEIRTRTHVFEKHVAYPVSVCVRRILLTSCSMRVIGFTGSALTASSMSSMSVTLMLVM